MEPPADPDRMRRNAIVGGTVAVLLVAFLVAAVFYVQSGSTSPFWGGGGADAPVTVFDQWRNGTMQGGALLPDSDPIYTGGDNAGSFTVPADATACDLALSWTKGASGAEEMRLEVTRGGSLVGDETGAPGLTLRLEGEGIAGATHGFRVLHDGSPGFVDQPFQLHIVCVR